MSTNNQLRKVADLLPPIPNVVRTRIDRVKGEELLKRNTQAIAKNPVTGKIETVHPKMMYNISSEVPVNFQNHFMNMKAALKKGGIAAVNQYINDCYATVGRENPGIRVTDKKQTHEEPVK